MTILIVDYLHDSINDLNCFSIFDSKGKGKNIDETSEKNTIFKS